MTKRVREYIAKLKNKIPTRSSSTGMDDHEKLIGMTGLWIITVFIGFIIIVVMTSQLGKAKQTIEANATHDKKHHESIKALNAKIDNKDHDIARAVGWYRTLEAKVKYDAIFDEWEKESAEGVESAVKNAQAWLKSLKKKEGGNE